MDHADPPLAGSPEPLHDSVAGTDAGPGEKYAMNPHLTSTEKGWGRGTAPLPQTPSPKTNLGRLHKSLDTPRQESASTLLSLFSVLVLICFVSTSRTSERIPLPSTDRSPDVIFSSLLLFFPVSAVMTFLSS